MEETAKRKSSGNRKPKISMETRQLIISLLKENNTIAQISNKVYVSRNTIRDIAKKEGITPVAGKPGNAGEPRRRYTEEQMRPVVGYARVHGFANSGRRFNIPESTIYWWHKTVFKDSVINSTVSKEDTENKKSYDVSDIDACISMVCSMVENDETGICERFLDYLELLYPKYTKSITKNLVVEFIVDEIDNKVIDITQIDEYCNLFGQNKDAAIEYIMRNYERYGTAYQKSALRHKALSEVLTKAPNLSTPVSIFEYCKANNIDIYCSDAITLKDIIYNGRLNNGVDYTDIKEILDKKREEFFNKIRKTSSINRLDDDDLSNITNVPVPKAQVSNHGFKVELVDLSYEKANTVLTKSKEIENSDKNKDARDSATDIFGKDFESATSLFNNGLIDKEIYKTIMKNIIDKL
jgi:DNA-binding transcriptional MerR regulator